MGNAYHLCELRGGVCVPRSDSRSVLSEGIKLKSFEPPKRSVLYFSSGGSDSGVRGGLMIFKTDQSSQFSLGLYKGKNPSVSRIL